VRVEPLYRFPVEDPGDTEGSTIVDGTPGDLLAVRFAAELSRIQGDIDAFEAVIAALPRTIQAGHVSMPAEVFTSVTDGFYNGSYLRGAEAIRFGRPFDAPPAVVLIPNNTSQPGFSMEATVTDVTTAGFTARLAVSFGFSGTFVCRWIAVEATQ
jgi:hypothetical protein